MAYLPQFEYDVCISYARIDNMPDSKTNRKGLVGQFHECLDNELSKQIGRIGAIKIWRNVRGYGRFVPTIQSPVERAAIFLALTSHGYFLSESCRKEINAFLGAAKTVRVRNHSRVFFVELQQVPRALWPEEINRLGILSYRFFATDKNPDAADPRSEIFQHQIRMLARDIIKVLELLRDVSPAKTQATTESVKPNKSSIFISYRRGESNPYAGRLYDQLAAQFGEDRVFMDLDKIEPGDDFVEVIKNYVSSCSILIALINRGWVDVKDDEGRQRLHDPADFVRLEISIAFQRNIRVIPVLVQGASMPRSQDLPESLSILSHRNALELSDLRWRSDVGKLIKILEKYL